MIWVGTSGYNYPEWRGTFYPDKLAAAKRDLESVIQLSTQLKRDADLLSKVQK